MLSKELEEFGRILVQHVRDAAIQSSDRSLRPGSNDVVAMRWRAAGAQGAAALAESMIPDVVDETIFYLLNALDQGLMELKFVGPSGQDVALHESGELAGWYSMSDDGWVARHSQERHVDDFADLDLD